MSKNKITILILAIAVMTLFISDVEAADTSLFVSPTTANKDIGSVFDVVVKVNPAGEKVCAVEGQLVLSKLTYQKIDLAQGIVPQTSPSFNNNLYFLLGIPGCTTQDKALFTVKVKADTVGEATASFRDVDIIGEGVSISSVSIAGNYKITIPTAPPTPTVPAPAPAPAPAPRPLCICDDWGSWQDRDCGQGDCAPTQRLQERTRICTPLGCDIEEQAQCVNDLACIALAEEKPVDPVAPVDPVDPIDPVDPVDPMDLGFVATIGMILGEIGRSAFSVIVVILCLMGLAIIGIREWKLFRKKRKK